MKSPMSKIRATNKESGFTLIELIIYMGIFSVASVLLTSMLVTSVKVQNRETSNNELTGQLNLVVQTVQRLVRESSLIEKVYEGTDESSACVSFCSVKLRMEESSLDPTVIRTDSAGIVYVKRGIGSETALTNDRVVVNSLIFTKNEIPKSHATLEVDAVMSSSAGGAPAGPSRELKSVVARTNAAVFDGNVIPNADQSLDLGDVFGDIKRWREGHFSGDVTIESGKVGIGTSSPSDELTVFGNIKIDGSGNGIVFSNGSSITSANGAASGGGWTDSGSIVRLTTDTDKVAIDVPTTTNKLEVNGNTNITGDLTLTGTCDGCGATDTITGTGATGYIAKWNTSGSLTSSAVFNDPSGNIGIGTASPSSKLHVVGTTVFDGHATLNGTCGGCGGPDDIWSDDPVLNRVHTTRPTRDVNLTGNVLLPATAASGSAGMIKLSPDNWIYLYGTESLFFGNKPAGSLVLQNYNTAAGGEALKSNNGGEYNTAVGSAALKSNVTGSFNTAAGADALINSNSSYNTGVGYAAIGQDPELGEDTAVGEQALFNDSQGKNTAVGIMALYSNTAGSENTAIGWSTMYSNVTGSKNVAIGKMAAYSGNNFSRNTVIGGEATAAGEQNTVIGVRAAARGDGNTIIGTDAMNVNFGGETDETTAIGFGALLASVGNFNTALGYDAGFISPGQGVSGSYNTYIGWTASSQSGHGDISNATAIGAGAEAAASNSLILGGTGEYGVNVGIGTNSPTQKLEVNGGVMLNTSTVQPACAAGTSGLFWFARGAAGVKDDIQVCAKDSSNAYAWRIIY